MNALVILGAAIAISWTAPGQQVSGYIGFRSWDGGAHWESARIWSDSAFTTLYTPGTQGTVQHAFLWTDAPYRNDMIAKIVAFNFYGSSGESNRIIISTGLPDTVMYLVRGYLPSGLPIIGQAKWPRNSQAKNLDGSSLNARGEKLTESWTLVPGDSAAFEVVTFEDVVRRTAMWNYIRSINAGMYPMWGALNPYPFEAKQ